MVKHIDSDNKKSWRSVKGDFWLWLAVTTKNSFWIPFGSSPLKVIVNTLLHKKLFWGLSRYGIYECLDNWSTGRGWKRWGE